VKIETTRQFDRALDRLRVPVQDEVLKAIPSLAKAFGKPHAHLGLRKLGGRIYEFRVGLKLRIVFRHDDDTLYLLLIGTHDEVRRFIRSL
jgi:mRNA-degrading endonuclease RelE of RelBE toxin-antitoxin system